MLNLNLDLKIKVKIEGLKKSECLCDELFGWNVEDRVGEYSGGYCIFCRSGFVFILFEFIVVKIMYKFFDFFMEFLLW